MSQYQGMCGGCDPSSGVACWSSPVLPSFEGSLSSTQRLSAKADAALFNHVKSAGPTYKFASAEEYLRYKKARVLANAATNDPYRGAPSSAVAAMQREGC